MDEMTNIEILRAADWDRMERDVVERIRMLKAMVMKLEPSELNDKIADELIAPNCALLAEFCSNVKIEDLEEGEV